MSGGTHSVLSSCEDDHQTQSTTGQRHGQAHGHRDDENGLEHEHEKEHVSTGEGGGCVGALLSVNPALADAAVESTTSAFSDQAEFELPPPMSELSSAVADAAASRNISVSTLC